MKFTEEKAADIIAKFKLSEKTILVWKTRNKIPDMYFNADFKKRETTRAGDVINQRLLNLLCSKTINIKVLSELTGIAYSSFADAMRKTNQTRLADADIKIIKVEINRLKINIAQTFEKFSPLKLNALFKNRLIVYTKIISNKNVTDKISYIRQGKQEPDQFLFNQVKDNYIIFAMTLNI
jgi:hypothetical protein